MSDVVAASLIAAVSTLAGVGLTRWFDGSAQRHAAEDRKAERHAEHKRWQRDQRAEAYTRLLTVASHLSGVMWTFLTSIEMGYRVDEQLPTADQHAAAIAAVDVYGHSDIANLARAWNRRVLDEGVVLSELLRNRRDQALRRRAAELHEQQIEKLAELRAAVNGDIATPPEF